MKLIIKSNEVKINIIFPTTMLLNRVVAEIAVKSIKARYPALSLNVKDFVCLINEVKRYKRKHGRLDLIDITTADGEVVYISL